MTNKSVKVIFDTNVWISFLIGKRLSKIKQHISDRSIIIVTSEQLLTEIKRVTNREKLQKYFPKDAVKELIEILKTIAQNVQIKPIHVISRDPKDNFLLDLIDISRADFLVTRDKLNPFKTAQIVTPVQFEEYLEKRK